MDDAESVSRRGAERVELPVQDPAALCVLCASARNVPKAELACVLLGRIGIISLSTKRSPANASRSRLAQTSVRWRYSPGLALRRRPQPLRFGGQRLPAPRRSASKRAARREKLRQSQVVHPPLPLRCAESAGNF